MVLKLKQKQKLEKDLDYYDEEDDDDSEEDEEYSEEDYNAPEDDPDVKDIRWF